MTISFQMTALSLNLIYGRWELEYEYFIVWYLLYTGIRHLQSQNICSSH